MLIRCLLALLEVQALAFNGLRPKLFTHATSKERTKNLAGWETSRLFHRRIVFMAIRTLLLWAYVDSQEAERGMGFEPGTSRTARRNTERLKAARLAISQAQGNGSGPSDEAAATFPKMNRTRPRGGDISSFEEQA
jgi:hypothetical protein